MTILNDIKIAIEAVKSNIGRAILTCLIIAVGIMALVGMLTAIDGMKASITKNFSLLGTNTFTIINGSAFVDFDDEYENIDYKPISIKEALCFKENFKFPGLVSVYMTYSWTAIVKYGTVKSNPNVQLTGADENFLEINGQEIEMGRFISASDVSNELQVAVIGKELKEILFKKKSALNKNIIVGGKKYLVIGVLKSKGQAFDFGSNRIVIMPYTNGKKSFYNPGSSYNIGVKVFDYKMLDPALNYSKAVFRNIRNLKPKMSNNFDFETSDGISNRLISSLTFVSIAAYVIAFITLFGASIGLMNIMLVSVKERTREIGTRKAIGAKNVQILRQFLTEAVIICQIGGLGGIVLGIAVGNIVSSLIDGPMILPWTWILLAIVLCTLVGLVSGIMPARHAARLDPIDSLRYE
ncbi:MAG: ABC transporter permease [Bacteroidetes bacterium]|nr:ABC transporter permease [Bacteroidota bacterium]